MNFIVCPLSAPWTSFRNFKIPKALIKSSVLLCCMDKCKVPLPALLILHKLYKSRQVLDFAGFFVAQNFKKCQGLSKICPAFTSRVHTFDHLSQTVPKKFFLYSKRGSASNSAVPLFIYTVCKPNASNCFYLTHK